MLTTGRNKQLYNAVKIKYHSPQASPTLLDYMKAAQFAETSEETKLKAITIQMFIDKDLEIDQSPDLIFSNKPFDTELRLPPPLRIWEESQRMPDDANARSDTATASQLYELQKALVQVITSQPLRNGSYIKPPQREWFTCRPESLGKKSLQLNRWLDYALKHLYEDGNSVSHDDAHIILALITECARQAPYLPYDQINQRSRYIKNIKKWGSYIERWLLQEDKPTQDSIKDTFKRLAFHLSIIQNDVETVKDLLENFPTIIQPSKGSVVSGQDCLFAACYLGHLASVQMLIDAGVSPNFCSRTKGFTPLNVANGNGQSVISAYLLNKKVLGEACADANFLNGAQETPIDNFFNYIREATRINVENRAYQHKVLKLLLEQGGKFDNNKATDLFAPLPTLLTGNKIITRDNSRVDIIKLLKLAKTFTRSKQSKPTSSSFSSSFVPLEVVNSKGKKQEIAPQQKKITKMRQEEKEEALLSPAKRKYMEAAQTGNLALITDAYALLKEEKSSEDTLWNIQDEEGRSPLMLALSQADPEKKYSKFIRHQFMRSGLRTSLRLQDTEYRTCVHLAILYNPEELLYLAREYPSEFNAVINYQDIDDKTALHYAVEKGDADTTQLLLKYGAKPFMKDAQGASAITIVANMHNSDRKKLFEEILIPQNAVTPAVTTAEDKESTPVKRIDEDAIITKAFKSLQKNKNAPITQRNKIEKECAVAESLLYKQYERKKNITSAKQLDDFLRLACKHKERKEFLVAVSGQFPDNVNFKISLAFSCYKFGDYAKAEKIFQSLLEMQPAPAKEDRSFIYQGLRQVYQKQERYADLQKMANKTIELVPEDFRAKIDLLWASHYLNQGESTSIVDSFKELRKIHSNESYITLELAWFLFKTHQYSLALKEFAKLKQTNPQEYLLGTARCYEFLRDPDKSYEYYVLLEEFADFYPGQASAAIFFTRHYPNDPAYQRRFLNLREKFSNVDSYLKSIHYHWMREEEDDARDIYQKGCRKFPDNAVLRLDLFNKYFIAGNFDKAIAILEEVLKTPEQRMAAPVLAKTPEFYQAYISILLHLNRGDEAFAMRDLCHKECGEHHLVEDINSLFDEENLSALEEKEIVAEEKNSSTPCPQLLTFAETLQDLPHSKVNVNQKDALLTCTEDFTILDFLANPASVFAIVHYSVKNGLRLSESLQTHIRQLVSEVKKFTAENNIKTASGMTCLAPNQLINLMNEHFQTQDVFFSIDKYYARLRECGLAELIFPTTSRVYSDERSQDWYTINLAIYARNNAQIDYLIIYIIMAGYENAATFGTAQFASRVMETFKNYSLSREEINTLMSHPYNGYLAHYASSAQQFMRRVIHANVSSVDNVALVSAVHPTSFMVETSTTTIAVNRAAFFYPSQDNTQPAFVSAQATDKFMATTLPTQGPPSLFYQSTVNGEESMEQANVFQPNPSNLQGSHS